MRFPMIWLIALALPLTSVGGGTDIYGNALSRSSRLGYVDGELTTVGDIADFAPVQTNVLRTRADLAVYRKVKDCWIWTDNPSFPGAETNAPADFLAYANSPGAMPLYFVGDANGGNWFGANQYWPNGRVKYDQGYGPGGRLATVLNFAFTACDETGTNALYRFGATATRTDPTNETLVCWDDSQRNQYVRIATTDLVDFNVRSGVKTATAYADAATNAIRRVDGAARPLPPYLHALDFDDSYPDDAAWYYAQAAGDYAQCSARRVGNRLERNYDWKFDDAAEFVVRVGGNADGRFASVGVANVGTNLTEGFVTSGRWSRYYKALPGHTVDGVNENGVVAEINVVGGDPQTSGWRTGGDIHPLAAVRWALDNGTSAGMVASNLALRIAFPQGWTQNFHYMIADAKETWIVENGHALGAAYDPLSKDVLANFRIYPSRDTAGEGQERYDALMGGENITSQWWTATYTPQGYRASDLPGVDTDLLFRAWAATPRESHRGETFGGEGWWQTVHTSVYDISNRTLRVAVQERDDWYVFALPSAITRTDETLTRSGVPADAKATGDAIRALTPPTKDELENLLGWRVVALAGGLAVQFAYGAPTPERDRYEGILGYRLRRRDDGTAVIEFEL